MTNDDRHNQDRYDVVQAQEEWDQKTSVAPVGETTVDIDRSDLSRKINEMFTNKYAVNPLQPAGELVKTWMMLHDEIQNIVEELEHKINVLEEKSYTS